MGILQAGGESAWPMMLTLRRLRKPRFAWPGDVADKAGAEICMDPEGHVWCCGSYRPSQPAT